MRPSLGATLQYVVPQRLLGRLIYWIARSRHRALATPLKRWFARHYRLDLSEAEHASPDDYESLNALFTRTLKPGARPLAADSSQILSPADGTLTEFGDIETDTLLQAKGMSYSLQELLGEEREHLSHFLGGRFATIYLAPHDYHRVHVPIASSLQRTRYLPGRRFSVNQSTVAAIPRLFCRNERVVFSLETATSRFALVMVGALNVSSISTVTLGEITSGAARIWDSTAKERFEAGDEVGCFNLGSTVVLIFGRDAMRWHPDLQAGRTVRLGEPIGHTTAIAPES